MSHTPFDRSRVRALLLDLDGTLADSTEDLMASGNALRAEKGLAPLGTAVIASYIGDGVEALVRRLLVADRGDVGREIAAFMLHYREHCLERTRLYPGVEATLKDLFDRGYRLAVVTNKPEKVSRRILEGLGLAPLLGSVVGGDTCALKKPHAEPLLRACSELGVSPREAVMVGDSRVDVEAGRNAAIPAIALLGGIGDEALLRAADPDVLLERFERLLDLFQKP